MTSPRTVAVFTSGRADWGPLEAVVAQLDQCASTAPVVIATGAHLDPRRGRTLDAIEVGSRTVLDVIETDAGADTPDVLAAALGEVAQGVSRVLVERGVDLLVVLGDRWELLGAAAPAVLQQVPIAHIHGGEVTEGAIDDRIRHAISKLADLHCCATEEAAARIRQLGEEPWRVHVTGAPALDRFRPSADHDLGALEERLGTKLSAPWGLVTYHPPTVDRDRQRERVRAVLDAATSRLASVVVTYPGWDPEGNAVATEISDYVSDHPTVHFVPSLGPLYESALAGADVMVGNSSSGIIEAATFSLPVVDVGDRQLGRLRPPNVVTAGETQDEIEHAIDRALDPEFRSQIEGLANPYGDGEASARILEVVRTAPLERLGRKRFRDLPEVDA